MFSGVVSHAIENHSNINDVDSNGLKEVSSSSSTLPACSLVCLFVSRENNNENKNNKSKKYGKSKKSSLCPHCKISDVNDDNASVDLKSLQIEGHRVFDPSCHESMHPNLCSKLKKESAD